MILQLLNFYIMFNHLGVQCQLNIIDINKVKLYTNNYEICTLPTRMN